ncbi:MAG: hypothetical protein K2O67_06860 [Clostridia bacterium]|nr:hypothetical protein [Clostridia bacterium]
MAKKNKNTTTTTSGNYGWVKVTAFWGIIIAGIAGIITFVLKLLSICGIEISWGNRIASIFSLVSQIAIFISVFLAAYAHSRHMSKGWRIAFWIFVILAILGLFGFSLMSIFR